YNMEKYLDNCIESLTRSKYINQLEILIVNDGSTDSTLEIARRWENEFPESIHVIDKENGGHGSAINIGSTICKGKYFKILDADDWVDTDEFDKLVEKLDTVDADCVVCNFVQVYESSGKTEICDSIEDIKAGEVIPFDEYIENHRLKLHSVSYKTQTYRDAQIKVSEKCFFEDAQYCLYAYGVMKDIVYFPYNIYQYRLQREGQSVSPQGFLKHLDDHRKVVKELCEYYKNANIESATIKERLKYEIGGHIQFQYRFVALYGTKEQLKETKQLNKEIKTLYKDIYKDMPMDKCGKLLRMFNFNCYPLIKLASKMANK
ncbi:MAG: glycosyltransferase family 2 protein, partial [Clostridia bacterium]|nr:glycosyltransferase family 2 protein [Clostridia bacterium]